MAVSIPTEQAALLAAIVAEPDDDTPRLVYADWLQENGDEEQAQFIRDSIAIEWLADYEDEKRQQTAMRLDTVASRAGPEWLGALGVTGSEAMYDRGMIEGLIYDCLDQFLENEATLFARVPIRSVTISDLELHERDGMVALAELPNIRRLRELRLHNRWVPVTADGFERFITSPYLVNLQALAVQEAALNDDDMLAFNRSEYLSALEDLALYGNQLTTTGALTVIRSPKLPNLQRLGLAHNNIVEDRKRGSAYLALRDAFIERFDSTAGL